MRIPVYGYRIARDYPVACLTFCHNLAAPDPGALAVLDSGTAFLPSPFEVEAEREMLSLRLIIGPMNTQVLRRYVRLQAQVTAEQELEGKLFRHAVGDLKQ